MSSSEFEALVTLFLDGNASAEHVARLRDALSASPALRARFQASARLHQAQLACLSRREERTLDGVLSWLHAYGQRMGRSFAHLCLLALVFVELQVTIPAEYSGLLAYVEAKVPAAEPVLNAEDMPVLVLKEVVQEAELSQSGDMPELAMPVIAMPVLGMPEMVAPSEQPVAIEV
jgi:hypothetical protein